MGRKLSISPDNARRIKNALWEGESTIDIANRFYTSQPTVSNIKTGRQYGDIPWPDQTLGGMPEYQRKKLQKSRYYDSKSASRLGERNTERQMDDLNDYMLTHYGQSLDDYVQEHIDLAAEKRFQKSQEDSERLANSIRAQNLPPAPPRVTKEWTPLSQPMVNWDHVMAVGSDWPLVQYYNTNPGDYDLYIAIRIMVWVMPESLHNTPTFVREVTRTKNKIAEWRVRNNVASDALALYNGDATGDSRPN